MGEDFLEGTCTRTVERDRGVAVINPGSTIIDGINGPVSAGGGLEGSAARINGNATTVTSSTGHADGASVNYHT